MFKEFLKPTLRAFFFSVTTLRFMDYISLVTGRMSSLNKSTVYGILTVEMVLHIIGCYRVIKENPRVEEEMDSAADSSTIVASRQRKVQTLVMSEFIEAIYPVAFGIIFTMAYYGPNVSLFRNIGNDYFGGKILENVNQYYTSMLQMLGFDLFAMIISHMTLKYFCQINLFKKFCNMMKNHWMIFLIKLPFIAQSFAVNDVNFGFDPSGEFAWINEEGRLNLICNSTELSNDEKQFYSQLQCNVTP